MFDMRGCELISSNSLFAGTFAADRSLLILQEKAEIIDFVKTLHSVAKAHIKYNNRLNTITNGSIISVAPPFARRRRPGVAPPFARRRQPSVAPPFVRRRQPSVALSYCKEKTT